MNTNPTSGRPMRLAALCSLLMMGAVIWPISQNWARKPKDGFPLSHYPMFAKNRNDKATLTYLLGIDRRGNRHFVSYTHAGTGGMNQVRKTINKRALKNPKALCDKVARSVARSSTAPDVLLDSIRIVKGNFQLSTFFGGNQTPARSKAYCGCAVPRKLTALNAR
ncbi:MAG: hypothetical protein H7Z72_16640 [Bacteroidetes bacterium]|nr:hypothetical protein [Fibrella sp.]